ncbi:antibiotic acetyltransferase [Bacteroides sp. AF16-49]|jgi:acetyltransferase-like isoleucine patch superfamily enzyme|nr:MULTISPECIES: CatB-related O-acetyltransferase [unclassified Bacteroides]RGN42095.1 antibiotic acetyltransferase [Bacteroides sp. OM05-12]RHR68797.1 antibiotic acetyltransferase [Bacteroides sp. AF16-49]
MQIKELLVNFINKKKFNKSISFLSFWDNSSIIPSNIYLGLGTRILNSKIGKYTRIKPFCVIKNANIGNYCSIANDVRIGLGKHPTGLISTNSIFYKTGIRKDWAVHIDYNEEETINIGNDVWIGNGAIIMDGITVGNGAIIGARALVTKDIPPYAIVGGIPAKIIKYRFDEETINLLQKSQWWDLPDKTIENILPIFTNSERIKDNLKKYLNNQ